MAAGQTPWLIVVLRRPCVCPVQLPAVVELKGKAAKVDTLSLPAVASITAAPERLSWWRRFRQKPRGASRGSLSSSADGGAGKRPGGSPVPHGGRVITLSAPSIAARTPTSHVTATLLWAGDGSGSTGTMSSGPIPWLPSAGRPYGDNLFASKFTETCSHGHGDCPPPAGIASLAGLLDADGGPAVGSVVCWSPGCGDCDGPGTVWACVLAAASGVYLLSPCGTTVSQVSLDTLTASHAHLLPRSFVCLLNLYFACLAPYFTS